MRIQLHHIPQRRVEPVHQTDSSMRVTQERYEATRREYHATSFSEYLKQAERNQLKNTSRG